MSQAPRIVLDAESRFAAGHVEALRAWTAQVRADGPMPDHPAAILGPWSELPDATREAIRRALAREIRARMDWYPRGPLWPRAIHGSARLGAALAGPAPLAARLARKVVVHGWSAPWRRRERRVLARRARRWQTARQPHLFDLLASLGLSPCWLEGDWADSVPVDPRAKTFFHDPRRNVLSGHLIGFDLIPAEDDVWCVEANLNTSFAEVRREQLNPEPAVPALLEIARSMDARHVWWVEQDHAPARPWLFDELGRATAQAGMNFRIFESWQVAGSGARAAPAHTSGRYAHADLRPPADTLILRRSALPLGPDRIIADKEPFVRGMASMLHATGESRVRVPEMSRDPDLDGTATHAGLPNLVYKYPDMGKGEGVHFLRAESEAHAVELAREIDRASGEPPGLFQPFVCSRILPGRRIYDVRCEMIVTPLGVAPVFALRREAGKPLPEHLPPGSVGALGVFNSNVSTGGHFAPIDAIEAESIWNAAHAIADTLRRLLARAYVVDAPT